MTGVKSNEANSTFAARGQRGPGTRGAALRFYTCVGILLVAAVSMQVAAKALGAYFEKQPVPLKRPLATFDRSKLSPEYGLHVSPPPPLTEDMTQTLGTEEYLMLRLVDAARGRRERTCVANVFVTYFTGKPDLVPHVPDECWLAGGFEREGAPEDAEVVVPGVGAPGDRVPVRLITFTRGRADFGASAVGQGSEKTTVLYFFDTNGRYVTTRTQVRLAQANLWDRYAYYAKFEISFSDYDDQQRANRAESLEALAPLLKKILPILRREHFQNWETWTASEQPAVPRQRED